MSEPSVQANVLAERLQSREFVLHGRARRVGDEARRGSARGGGQDGRGAANRRHRRHQLCRWRDRARPGAHCRRRRVAGADAEHPHHLRRPGPQGHRQHAGDARIAAHPQHVLHQRRLAEELADAARLRRRLGAAGGGGVRPPAEARHAVPHLVRGLAVQVPARGLPLPVPEAREEDRRRRQHGHHPGRLGRQEVHRAEALSRRARPTTPISATSTCSAPRRPSAWARATRPAAGRRRSWWRPPRAKPRAPTRDWPRGSSAPPSPSPFSRASATPAPTSAARTTPITSPASSSAARSWRRGGRNCCRPAVRPRRTASISTSRRSEPKPSRTFLPMVLDAAATALPVPWVKQPQDTPARRVLKGAFAWLDRHPALSHAVRARRVPVEARDLRLQELRQLRARQHGVRLSRRPARSRCATARAAAPTTASAR